MSDFSQKQLGKIAFQELGNKSEQNRIVVVKN
jgi:hypothetical protein